MKKLLVATGNQGKLGEIKKFLKDLKIEIVSLKDLNLKQNVEEDGKTYQENSAKKALFFAEMTNLPTLADDGGVEIDALGGKPGLYSKYWAKDEETIIKKLEQVATEIPENNRGAVFKVVLTLALPDGRTWSVGDQVKGIITRSQHMKRVIGYPYRSFFYIPEIKSYYHEDEMTEDQLRMYNHRYKAIEKIKKIIIKTIINEQS